MSKGKYCSLEEARRAGDLEGFAKAHPSTGDQGRFNDCLKRMAFNKPVESEGSKKPSKKAK